MHLSVNPRIRRILRFVGVGLIILFGTLIFLVGLLLAVYQTLPEEPKPAHYTYGITFSKPFADKLKIDWRDMYRDIVGDLGITTIRLSAYWPDIEPIPGTWEFTDLDWQIAEAKSRGVSVVLAMGQKLPRWPECHYPAWMQERVADQTKPLSASEREGILRYMRAVVERYKNEEAITHWQVENEPFLPFGICPPLDVKFLDEEIALVRSLDSSRPLIVTEPGEFSTWQGAASRADIMGTTLYRVVWWPSLGYFEYPIPESFFRKKIALTKRLNANLKDLICIELQGEPWAHLQIYENTVEEMMKTMHHEQFAENLRYARSSHLATQYVWGAEWWWWMAHTKNDPYYWDTARAVFRGEYAFPGE